ncbi:MAG: nucleotidyltransferase family protein [Candidatus Asgardarchaeia archaeon]
MISAIILAAGKSERMGQPKLILPLNGKTVIEKVVEEVKESNVEEILVVLGHNYEKIIPYLEKEKVSFTINFFYEYGMTSSFKVGLSKVSNFAEAAILILGDQPLITSEVINEIINVYRHTSALIVSPRVGRKKAHPVLFDKKTFADILNMPQDGIIRDIVHKYALQHVTFNWSEEEILFDMDTPKDYEKIRKLIKKV